MNSSIEQPNALATYLANARQRRIPLTIAFEVSFVSSDADLAAKVANELTTLYLNENLNNRTQLARDAATFLESEGDRLNHRIGELEAQLARFKDKNFHQLPELTPLNL